MKKLGNNGFGLEAMIGFLIAFALVLIVIVVLFSKSGV